MRVLNHRVDDRILLVPAALAFVLLGLVVWAMFRQVSVTYVFIGLYAVFGLGGLWLYRRYEFWRREVPDWPWDDITTPVRRRLLSLSFFALFSLAVLTLKFRSPGAVRPTSFYVVVALAVGVLAIRSLFTTGDRGDVWIVLLQVLLLGALIRFALVYLNPYPYFSDATFHWTLVQKTIETGGFDGELWFGAPYQYYPVYHTFDAATFLLATGRASPAWLYPVVNTTLVVLTIFGIFSIARRLANARVALLAGVLTLTGNFYFLQPHYTTNWVAITFLVFGILVLVTLLATFEGGENLALWATFWVLAAAGLLVHPVNFITFALFVAGGYVAALLLRRTHGIGSEVPFLSMATLFVLYAFYVHRGMFVTIVEALVGTARETQGVTHTANVQTVPVFSSYTTELVLNYLGVTALVLFVVPALLYGIRNRDAVQNTFTGGVGAIYVFVLVVFVSGLGGELEIARTVLYISPFLGILGAIGLYHTVGAIGRERVFAAVFAFVVVLSFLSMASYTAGNFNGMYAEDVNHYRLTVAPSTLDAHDFVQQVPEDNATITSDYITAQYIAAYDSIGGSTEAVRTMYPLEQYDQPSDRRLYFGPNWTSSRYYIVNEPHLEISGSYGGPDYVAVIQQTDRTHSRVYATRRLGIYYNGTRTDAENSIEPTRIRTASAIRRTGP